MEFDKFENRKAELMINGDKVGLFFGKIETTQPMFITLDDEMVSNTYKEEPLIKTTPAVTLGDQEYQMTYSKERFIHMGRVHSYLNGSSLDIHYDNKYEDILFTPILDYVAIQPKNLTFDCYCFRLGHGAKLESANSNKLVLPVNEDLQNGRYKLPVAKKLTTAKVRLVSYAGMQHAGFTQDANTFEEMLDQNVNLKRSQRNMYNILELGTVNEVFNGTDIPHYLLQQIGPRLYDYKYLGSRDPGNQKIYVPLPF